MGECAPREGGNGQSSWPMLQDSAISPARASVPCRGVAVPRLTSLPLSCLFLPQRSSLSYPRLHSWSRWRLWCPCWTALTSKVPLWGCSSTLLLGEVGGWPGLPCASGSLGSSLVCSLSLPSLWGYLLPALGLKWPEQRVQFQNLRQFGPKDTSLSPAAPNSGYSFYLLPHPLSICSARCCVAQILL